MLRLYGDGFATAYVQCCLVYYLGAAFLRYVVPVVLPRPSVQKGKPRPGQIRKEAILSLGATAFVGVLRMSPRAPIA